MQAYDKTMERNRLRDGFSLVEVLIILVVLSVGVFALARMQGIGLANGVDIKLRTQAAALAQQKSAELAVGAVAGAAGQDTVKSNAMTFNRTWEVTANPAHPTQLFIDVDVTYTDIAGARKRASSGNAVASSGTAGGTLVVR